MEDFKSHLFGLVKYKTKNKTWLSIPPNPVCTFLYFDQVTINHHREKIASFHSHKTLASGPGNLPILDIEKIADHSWMKLAHGIEQWCPNFFSSIQNYGKKCRASYQFKIELVFKFENKSQNVSMCKLKWLSVQKCRRALGWTGLV